MVADEQVNAHLEHIAKSYKYRIMWELRDLEAEILADGGSMFYTRDCKLRLALNSEELAGRIMEIVQGTDWDYW